MENLAIEALPAGKAKSRFPVKLAVTAAFLTLILLTRPAGVEPVSGSVEDARPNIIFVTVDALRADHVSSYGYPRQTTPVLDSALAAEGVQFTEATAVSSWTNPSNGALLTSLMPSDIDTVWADLNGSIPESETLLAEYLQNAGYVTAGFISSWYMRAQYGYGQGFDVYQHTDSDDQTRAVAVNRLASAWLDENEHLLGDEGSPLFLFLYYYDPHTHYDPPAPYDTMFDPGYSGSLTPELYGHGEKVVSGDMVLSARDLEHLIALYDGDIAYWDEQFGIMLDDLESRGLLQNSLIVLSSDHGQMFGEHEKWVHRNSLYEEVLRVPLLFRLSGVLPAGKMIQAPVDHLDVTPTVLELAGIAPPAHMRGRSLSPLMKGEGPLQERAIYAEMEGERAEDGGPHWIAPPTHLYAVKEDGYKYIHAERLSQGDELYDIEEASVFETQNIIELDPQTAESLWLKLQKRFTIPTEFLFLPVVERK